jgi:hypothetical protein
MWWRIFFLTSQFIRNVRMAALREVSRSRTTAAVEEVEKGLGRGESCAQWEIERRR